MSKHTIAFRGQRLPSSVSTLVKAQNRQPKEIHEAQLVVAESIPQEDTAQAARIFVEGEDASSKGAEEINSLANTEVSPIWKVGGCVVWNQVAKETQAIYEITEIGDDDWATICAIARSGYASGTLARTPFGRIARFLTKTVMLVVN